MSTAREDPAARGAVAIARLIVAGAGAAAAWQSLVLLSSDDAFFGLLEGLLGVAALLLAVALLTVGTWRLSADPLGAAACVHAVVATGGLALAFLATGARLRVGAGAAAVVALLGLAAIVRSGLPRPAPGSTRAASAADWSAAQDLPFDAG